MFWWCIKGGDYYHEVKNGGNRVDLSDRKIGDEEAEQISKALMDPNTLVQNLVLDHNIMEKGGAKALAEALKKFETPSTTTS